MFQVNIFELSSVYLQNGKKPVVAFNAENWKMLRPAQYNHSVTNIGSNIYESKIRVFRLDMSCDPGDIG